MRAALSLAQTASAMGEVPVGAIIVFGETVVGSGFNSRERNYNPLGHAELGAIQQATRCLQSWRLSNCRLYVTLEPCIMCAGALWQSRIDEVIFGATDPKGGGLGGVVDINKYNKQLNHQFKVRNGLYAEASSRLLKGFFAQRRKIKK